MSEGKEQLYFVMESEFGFLFQTISDSEEKTRGAYICMGDLRELDVECVLIKITKIERP